MTKRQKRLLIIVLLLLLVLALLTAVVINYRATSRLMVPFVQVATDQLTPPEYLYSFSGVEGERLTRPIGVLADPIGVYVTDSRGGKVYVFNVQGEFQFSFGEDVLDTPLYVARNPLDGNLYVSDRRTRSIQIFDFEGTHIGEFEPNLPEEELPAFDTGGVEWVPLAIDFADDGSMVVTDLLAAHRVLVFDPQGTFVRAVGSTGMVDQAAESPLLFQFPNNVKTIDDEIWVADSNNRRLQVLGLSDGQFDRLVVTEGLPRGFDFLTLQSEESTPNVYIAVADTLAHDVTLWSMAGNRQLTFGSSGVLEGQFSYPNDLSVGPGNRIFVTDSANSRVQVWGWPEDIAPVPAITVPPYWLWCLSPLLLLPLLLLLRRKRFFATDDFLDVMIEGELVDHLAHGKGRKYWMVMPATYERLRQLEVGDVKFQYLLHDTEHSDSDARALMERLEIEYETAAILSIARRAKVFCTENADLRKLARALELTVVDHEEYLERHGRQRPDKR